jgi:cysteine desulfurase
MSQPIYLDHAATTPVDPVVFDAMKPYFTDKAFNPSATYEAARQVKREFEAARASLAHYLGVRGSELIFTAGGTEANNLAINGIMQQYPDGEIIVSSVEHDSVLMAANQYKSVQAPVGENGRIDLAQLEQCITDHTVLVSIQYANNEVGTVQPLKEIAQLIAKKRTERAAKSSTQNARPLYFHTDACQAPAYLDIHVSRLGVDLLTINASKIYGPKQIGCLFVKSGIILQPQILGGGQERGLRSGTENVPAVIGFVKALELVQERRHEETKRVKQLQDYFLEQLNEHLPTIQINGSLKHRLANNVHITIPGYDNETLMMQLDDKGVICAVGSACSASNEEPSHVLKAMGMSDAAAQSSLRFTMGKSTTKEDITYVIRCLTELVK